MSLRKGHLYLGHMVSVIGTKTLEDTYLIPLIRLVEQNNGTVYRRSARLGSCLQFSLLVDIKSMETAVQTYQHLEELLHRLDTGLTDGRPIFDTRHSTSHRLPSPIRVVVTGVGRHFREISQLMDSRQQGSKTWLDLNQQVINEPRVLANSAWISQKWPFSWPVEGDKLVELEQALGTRVKYARSQGLRVRYWATPEDPVLWSKLLEVGVDLLNTDRIFTMYFFLNGLGDAPGHARAHTNT